MRKLKSLIKDDIAESKLIPPRNYHFIFVFEHSFAASPITYMITKAMQNKVAKIQNHAAKSSRFKRN
jgi:hypothetical protein